MLVLVITSNRDCQIKAHKHTFLLSILASMSKETGSELRNHVPGNISSTQKCPPEHIENISEFPVGEYHKLGSQLTPRFQHENHQVRLPDNF
jgi:hypothetical protein